MNHFWSRLKRLDDLAEHLLFDVLLSHPRRVLALGLVVAAAVMLGVPAETPEAEAREATVATEAATLEYLTDRPWFDGYPVNPTPQKPYHAYLFTSDGMGIYITLKSRYTQELELFYYKLKGTEIEIYLPETKTKARGAAEIRSANGPGDFDIELALAADPKNGGGKAKYYSWKHWGNAEGEAMLAELLDRLPAE